MGPGLLRLQPVSTAVITGNSAGGRFIDNR
jgi:hypothetical protein